MSNWFLVADDKSQVGPLTTSEMEARIGKAELRPDSLVWREGMAQWIKAGQSELAGAFRAAGMLPPPIPMSVADPDVEASPASRAPYVRMPVEPKIGSPTQAGHERQSSGETPNAPRGSASSDWDAAVSSMRPWQDTYEGRYESRRLEVGVAASAAGQQSGFAASPMSFSHAIASCLGQYVNFSGRASRSEYWYWALAAFLLSVIVTILTGSEGASNLASLLTLLPSLAVGTRRLHDIDRSGWWLLVGIIPVLGWIVLLVWFCQAGTSIKTKYD